MPFRTLSYSKPFHLLLRLLYTYQSRYLLPVSKSITQRYEDLCCLDTGGRTGGIVCFATPKPPLAIPYFYHSGKWEENIRCADKNRVYLTAGNNNPTKTECALLFSGLGTGHSSYFGMKIVNV